MTVRIGSRVETRLDESHRKQLAEILEKRDWTFAAFVRRAIEAEQQRLEDEEFETLLKSFDDDPIPWPSWEVLKREIVEMHCPGDEFCDGPDNH